MIFTLMALWVLAIHHFDSIANFRSIRLCANRTIQFKHMELANRSFNSLIKTFIVVRRLLPHLRLVILIFLFLSIQ